MLLDGLLFQTALCLIALLHRLLLLPQLRFIPLLQFRHGCLLLL